MSVGKRSGGHGESGGNTDRGNLGGGKKHNRSFWEQREKACGNPRRPGVEENLGRTEKREAFRLRDPSPRLERSKGRGRERTGFGAVWGKGKSLKASGTRGWGAGGQHREEAKVVKRWHGAGGGRGTKP